MAGKFSVRVGISVIEVLTSIVVATIGIAGIMILIPFGIGQAELGLDQEIATNLAQNAAAEFELRGLTDTSNWSPNPSGATARSHVLDPIGVSAREENGDANTGFFPFVNVTLGNAVSSASQQSYFNDGIVSADKSILIERKNLASSASTPFQKYELARTLFQWNDDLVFETSAHATGFPSPDLSPPQQVYDYDRGAIPAPVRRQAEREMSFIVVSSLSDLFPDSNISGYPTTPNNPDSGVNDIVQARRNYVLAYRRRVAPTGATSGFDRTYCAFPPGVNPTVGTFALSSQSRIAYSGGDLFISDDVDPNLDSDEVLSNNHNSTQRAEIRRGDWMALTNVRFNEQISRFVRNIEFYQVLDAWYEDAPAIPKGWHVTLQGPDFDFGIASTDGVPDDPQNYGTGQSIGFPDYCAKVSAGSTTYRLEPSKTYAIHLPDVWAVIERTYATPTNY